MASVSEQLEKLEKLGEEEVRLRLARAEFGQQGFNRQVVEDWLAAKAHLSGNEASREQILLAREAANQARSANTNAKIAVIIGIASIAVSIILHFL